MSGCETTGRAVVTQKLRHVIDAAQRNFGSQINTEIAKFLIIWILVIITVTMYQRAAAGLLID
jgi:hypothetical protein